MKKKLPKIKKISDEGLALIAEFEGFKGIVYADVVGLWTIGYGHLLTKDELTSGKIWVSKTKSFPVKKGLTKEQANLILDNDADIAESAVAKYVTVEINQAQFDALCSFVFNVGVGAFQRSTLLKVLNKGQFDQIPAQFKRWVFAAGKKIRGLEFRRAKEAKHFQGLPYNFKIKAFMSY